MPSLMEDIEIHRGLSRMAAEFARASACCRVTATRGLAGSDLGIRAGVRLHCGLRWIECRIVRETRRFRRGRSCRASASGPAGVTTLLAVAELYDEFGLPAGTPRFVATVLAGGLPFAVLVGWYFDARTRAGTGLEDGTGSDRAGAVSPIHAPVARESIVVLPWKTVNEGVTWEPVFDRAASPPSTTSRWTRRIPRSCGWNGRGQQNLAWLQYRRGGPA